MVKRQRGRLQTPRAIVGNVQRHIVKLYSDPLIVDKMIKDRHQRRDLDA
jgi:hypothetical protein